MSTRIPKGAIPGITPGEWLGDFAAGVTPQDRGRAPISVEDPTRSGEGVAKQFPWIASIFQRLPLANGSRIKFVRGAGGEPSFYNNTNRPVYIDEIRIYAMPMPQTQAHLDVGVFQIGRHCGLRLYKQNVEYVRDWLPLWNFQTESNRNAESARYRGAFQLPAPYYLNHGHTFRLRTRQWWPVPLTDNLNSYCSYASSLHGQDVTRNIPVKLVKRYTPSITGATPANPIFSVIPFDDNRDVPLNDFYVEHIGFGIGSESFYDGDNPQLLLPWAELFWLQYQFLPPDGPKWMDTEDWIPLWGIIDQPGPITWSGDANSGQWDQSMIIHRPRVPYVLGPREELCVEIRNFKTLTYNVNNDVPGWVEVGRGIPIWCTMYGRQESLA